MAWDPKKSLEKVASNPLANVAIPGIGAASAAVSGDPYRTGRAIMTGGASEAYKRYTDPNKEDIKSAEGDMAAAREGEYQARRGVAQQMSEADKQYADYMEGRGGQLKGEREQRDTEMGRAEEERHKQTYESEKEFQLRNEELRNQAESQASDARQTYTNTVQPAFKNMMEDAQTQSRDAMSLREAGDMNNQVQRGVRDFYEQQAQGEGRQGLADVGVLSALGAQATAGQMGMGSPLTGSQLQLLNAQNQAQSGQAFATTQRRLQALRDQGRQQALAMSEAQYERGQRAKDRERGAASDYEGVGRRMREEQQGFRGEMGTQDDRRLASRGRQTGSMADRDRMLNAMARDRMGQFYNLDTGMAGLRNQQAQNRGLMDMDLEMARYGNARTDAYNRAVQAQGELAGKNQMIGGIIGTAGTVAGTMLGGPAGGAVGGAAGNVAGNMATGGQTPGVAANFQQPTQQVPYYQQPRSRYGNTGGGYVA